MKKIAASIVFLMVSVSAWAGGKPAERRFIDKGMTEAEVFIKIGKPDYKSTVSAEAKNNRKRGSSSQKQWTYLPATGDRQTITTITFAGGRVVDIDRNISR